MIFDKIANHLNYRGLSVGLDSALDYLLETDLEALETGRHDIKGDDIYAACMEYETKIKTLSKNEAHNKYIDVQYIVRGIEKMYVSEIENLQIVQAYDPEKDVIFYEQKADCSFTATEGCFAIFFPEDAHMPGINPGTESVSVKKVVVKVHV